MVVDTVVSRQRLKDGTVREYSSVLLRRSVRDGAKVGKETLANLSMLPAAAVDAVRQVLAGKTVEAEAALQVRRSLPHGHVALVHSQAKAFGAAQLLGPAGRTRDLAYALTISRVEPDSKLSTLGWWDDVTLGADLGVAGASTDEVYAATDWLLARQDAIEAVLARRHLTNGGMALFDLLLLGEATPVRVGSAVTAATANAARHKSSTAAHRSGRAGGHPGLRGDNVGRPPKGHPSNQPSNHQ